MGVLRFLSMMPISFGLGDLYLHCSGLRDRSPLRPGVPPHYICTLFAAVTPVTWEVKTFE